MRLDRGRRAAARQRDVTACLRSVLIRLGVRHEGPVGVAVLSGLVDAAGFDRLLVALFGLLALRVLGLGHVLLNRLCVGASACWAAACSAPAGVWYWAQPGGSRSSPSSEGEACPT